MTAAVSDIEDFGPECTCAQCAALCEMVPGRMMLDDAERLQEYLGGPAEMLGNTIFDMVVDTRTRARVRVMRPRVVVEPVGGVVCEVVAKCGPCTFLNKDTGCTLTTATGKPTECRTTYGCVGINPMSSEMKCNTAKLIESWTTLRAKSFVERLDAIAWAAVPPVEAAVLRSDEITALGNPYGVLLLLVNWTREQSINSKNVIRLARQWGDTHKSVKTGKAIDPDCIIKNHRGVVLDGLRDAVQRMRAMRAKVRKDDKAHQEIIEQGRKRVRISILETLHALDTDMVEVGSIKTDGELLYLLREWIQTLTRP